MRNYKFMIRAFLGAAAISTRMISMRAVMSYPRRFSPGAET